MTISDDLQAEFKKWLNSLPEEKMNELDTLIKKANEHEFPLGDGKCGCWTEGMYSANCILHSVYFYIEVDQP